MKSIENYTLPFAPKQPKAQSLIIAFGSSLGSYYAQGTVLDNWGQIEANGKNQNNLLTLDIAMNPGDSGSPVVNNNGELVGVVIAVGMKENGKSLAVSSAVMENILP
ncbi:trypsin-like peptidase domain-containing protein [Candidatus Peregrinibacteria bacterium]|nr:trypsin-like peptidase domain-containing protein [Candidatus Peregrinibacteria bacterium]